MSQGAGTSLTGIKPTVTVTDIALAISEPPGTTIFTCTASNPPG
jgi:hypothetical protein